MDPRDYVLLGAGGRWIPRPSSAPTGLLGNCILGSAYYAAHPVVPMKQVVAQINLGLHADYHQPSDTADKIRYAELARVVAVAAEMTRAYLDGEPRPAFQRPKWFVTPGRKPTAGPRRAAADDRMT